MKHKDCIL